MIGFLGKYRAARRNRRTGGHVPGLSSYSQDQFLKMSRGQPTDKKSPRMWVALLNESPARHRVPSEVTYEGYARQPSRFDVKFAGDEATLQPLDEMSWTPPPDTRGRLLRWLSRLPLIGRFFRDKRIIWGWAIYDRPTGGNLIYSATDPVLGGSINEIKLGKLDHL